MADQSSEAPEAVTNLEYSAAQGLGAQLKMMWQAFRTSPECGSIFMLAGAIFAVIVVTAFGQIQLNAWNRPFYDAISRRDVGAFLHQLIVFCVIGGGLLVLNVAQTWLNQMTRLKLRAGLVHDLLDQWLEPRRAFRLAHASTVGVNPDQRLHEDTRHLTELSTDLGIGLLQASILLIGFVDVLWSLSSGFVFPVAGYAISIPGYMVWAALLYAATGSFFSWRVGRSLINLNADRYEREAELRYSLVRVSEAIDAISLYRGESDEKRHLNADLGTVLAAMRKLVTAATRLTWVTAGYGWFTLVVPILVAAPVYFNGYLSFGGLMVAVGAFNQVQTSLRWFVDNFNSIADWRATLLRVAEFRRAVLLTDVLHEVSSRIEIGEAAAGHLTFEDLAIASQGSCSRLVETHVDITAGQRVLIVGEPGADKTQLFRAIAGLWPWGVGRICLPKGEAFIYVPRRPYMPPGTLRDALAYPAPATTFGDAAFVAALTQVGLEGLAPRLDTHARWDRELSDDDQQRLAFARLSLHRPPWILIDEALETLDDAARARLSKMFETDLAGSTVIHIGRADSQNHIFNRVLHLIEDPQGCKLPAPSQPSANIRQLAPAS